MKSRTRRFLSGLSLVFVLAVLIIQFVPYRAGRVNPPTIAEPKWDSPETRALARRACFDCHSNETAWPAYSRIAPISWLIQREVAEGRAALNFSEWHRPQKEAKEAAEEVLEGKMPPGLYQVMHADARITPAEREHLGRGFQRTLAAGNPELAVR